MSEEEVKVQDSTAVDEVVSEPAAAGSKRKEPEADEAEQVLDKEDGDAKRPKTEEATADDKRRMKLKLKPKRRRKKRHQPRQKGQGKEGQGQG